MEENELIYRRWIEEVWNQKREEVIEDLFDKDGVAFYPYFLKSDEPLRGIKKIRGFFRFVHKHYPDLKIVTDDLAVVENKVVSVCLISAAQKTKPGGLPENRRAEVKSLCQIKIKDGKIIELWNDVDLRDQNPNVPLLKL